MSFFDIRILIRKRDNIPTSEPLSSPSLTQRARQTPPAALLMELPTGFPKTRRNDGTTERPTEQPLANI